MAVKAVYKSDAFEAIPSAVADMLESGTIDKQTMRRFDETCLASPDPMSPDAIKALRERNHGSQASLRTLSQHQPIHRAEVGEWLETAQRPGAQASGHRGEARDWGSGVSIPIRAKGPLT